MAPDSDVDVSNSTKRESRKYEGCVDNNGRMFLHGDPSTGFRVIRECRHRYEHKASLSFFRQQEEGDTIKYITQISSNYRCIYKSLIAER
jgi:hypothetical protein